MSGSFEDDKEKVFSAGETAPSPELAYTSSQAVVSNKYLSKLTSWGVESRGIERVTEEERVPRRAFDNVWMWFSVNGVLTTIPIGVLGQEFFGLTLPHSIATIIIFGGLGCATTAFISTLGPKTGLRTMVISRYAGGHLGGIIFSVLNILTQLGFSVTCLILGGQTLSSINGTLPSTVAIIIMSLCSLVICVFGYEYLSHYQRYAWIVMLFIFCSLYGLGGQAGYDIGRQASYEHTGSQLTGDVLTFGAVVFGSASGWAPIAADYNVKLPADTSSTKVFWFTFIGLFLPITFVEILGATLITITGDDYLNAFAQGNTGAVLGIVLSPWGGFGKFLLVILSLSVISNNVPNIYSTALSIQTLWKPLEKIPRFAWTILVALVSMGASIAGRDSFAAILSNMLTILSYWTAFFYVIVAEEHYIFRRKNGPLPGYNLSEEGYNERSLLPPGFACLFAILCGCAGAALGMTSDYFTGPVAYAISAPNGGDLGFELSAIFSAIAYPVARHFEIKKYGR